MTTALHSSVSLLSMSGRRLANIHAPPPDKLPGTAGPTTSQSLAVLKKNGHISFVLNENINYFKLTAG